MKKNIMLTILVLVIAGGLVYWIVSNSKNGQPTNPVACTAEAQMCPDGTYVGREGPNCEFAPCPAPTTATNPINTDWLTFSDATQGISFQYPETLGTTYILTQEWPPKVTVSDEAFSCTPTGSANGLPETTDQKLVNGIFYCITKTDEGAAGTTYSTYNYVTIANGKHISLDFILRYPQCGNYPDPQLTECNSERASFDLDQLIDQIAQTVKTK